MMQIRTCFVVGALFLLAACPGDPQPSPDTVAPDVPPADIDTPFDAADDTPVDTAPNDIEPDDIAEDIAIDDAADTTLCPDVSGCTLVCEHGRRLDANGCETCECRDCAAPTDCKLPACADPVCSDEGVCGCNCETFVDRAYQCPDGARVPFCACADGTVSCDPHPELQCLALCELGTDDALPCPGGTTVPWCSCVIENTCTPECRNGPDGEGWYNPCDDALLLAADCDGCIPVCEAIGSRSEGWYDSCGGQRIAWGFCGPRRSCRDGAIDACPTLACEFPLDQPVDYTCRTGASVPFCGCDVPAAACEPVCRNIGTADEGWFDGCSETLLQKTTCSGCTVTCDAIGTRSEGWYSSCSGLIDYAFCASGTWTCNQQPWFGCDNPTP
jgi:hypothetical protein